MVKVKYNKPSMYTVGDVTLIGGENEVPQEKIEAFLAHPHVKIKMKSGLIEVVGKKETRTDESTTGDDTGADAEAASKAAAAKAEKASKAAGKAK